VNFAGASLEELNNAGQIAFRASLTGSGVDRTNDRGIWSEGSGTLALVARTGSQAPDTPSGTNFHYLGRVTLNNAGQTAFLAQLTGSGVDTTNDEGLWSEGSGTLRLIAREGVQAPGTPDGVNYGKIGIPRAKLNDAGQVAFSAWLTGTGVDETNDAAIWATDRTGDLQLIVREGELLEIAPDDFRTVRGAFFLSDNLNGNSAGFNNLGQLAFEATFTDGTSGIFVSNRVAIPEPSTLLLAALSVAGLLLWRRLGGGRKKGTLIFADRHSSGLVPISADSFCQTSRRATSFTTLVEHDS
jgi:hypothetical protein